MDKNIHVTQKVTLSPYEELMNNNLLKVTDAWRSIVKEKGMTNELKKHKQEIYKNEFKGCMITNFAFRFSNLVSNMRKTNPYRSTEKLEASMGGMYARIEFADMLYRKMYTIASDNGIRKEKLNDVSPFIRYYIASWFFTRVQDFNDSFFKESDITLVEEFFDTLTEDFIMIMRNDIFNMYELFKIKTPDNSSESN